MSKPLLEVKPPAFTWANPDILTMGSFQRNFTSRLRELELGRIGYKHIFATTSPKSINSSVFHFIGAGSQCILHWPPGWYTGGDGIH